MVGGFIARTFVENFGKMGRRSVHVSYCVWMVVVGMEYGDGIERAYRRVNEGVAIECDV